MVAPEIIELRYQGVSSSASNMETRRAGRLGAELGHLAGVGEGQNHYAGGRDASDGPQAASLLIESGYPLALGKFGMEHEGHRVPAMRGHYRCLFA